jgi:hypothetical protein
MAIGSNDAQAPVLPATPPAAPRLELLAISQLQSSLRIHSDAIGETFEVEKSADGVHFETSTETKKPGIVIDAPAPGSSFHFRARSIDAAGRKSTWSKPVILSRPATPAPTTAAQLDQLLQTEKREEAAASEANRAAGFAMYMEILTREAPLPDDVATLRMLFDDPAMRLTEARWRADVELVNKVRAKRLQAAKYQPLDPQKLKALQDARTAAKKAFEEADKAPSRYRSACAMGRMAEQEIRQIAGTRPELFAPGNPGELPKFLTEA